MISFLSEKSLRRLAGAQSYSRGEEYFECGCVISLEVAEDGLSATVQGTELYDVQIRSDDGDIEYFCTCPYHQDDGAFCKHCVAATLAALNDQTPAKKSAKRASEEELKSLLEKQDKRALVAELLKCAKEDERIEARLRMKTAKNGKKLDLDPFRRGIAQTVRRHEFVDYRSTYAYARQLQETADSLRELLSEGYASEVIELAEFFLKELEEQLHFVDDSDGVIGGFLSTIQALHHDACVKARPDPEKLARRLFEWELKSDWEVFYGAASTYKDVLGRSGLHVYRELAEKEWASVPSLGPGDRDNDSRHRFRITSMMENLATIAKDVEQLVHVKMKNLSLAYYFLEIAQVYKKAGKPDKALRWAEKGIKAFPRNTDSRLREFLASMYLDLKRTGDAMSMIWANFADDTSLENYKKLKTYAKKTAQSWLAWRDKAIPHVRRTTARSGNRSYSYGDSLLVDIFVLEKNYDLAWEEAKTGGCSDHQWLQLADKRAKDHPQDAIEVYTGQIENMINLKNNQAYAAAAKLIQKTEKLFHRLGQHQEWDDYINRIRTRHKPKRNFIAMIEKTESRSH